MTLSVSPAQPATTYTVPSASELHEAAVCHSPLGDIFRALRRKLYCNPFSDIDRFHEAALMLASSVSNEQGAPVELDAVAAIELVRLVREVDRLGTAPKLPPLPPLPLPPLYPPTGESSS